MSNFRTATIVAGVLLVAFAAVSGDRYFMDIFIFTCFYGTLAVCWNMMAGLTGLMSLGHALFVGIGAYSVAWGLSVHGWSPLVTWPLGVGLAVAAAAAIGMLCFRYGLRGYFFAIATLAFGEVAFFTVSATEALGRSDGMIMPISAEDIPGQLQFFEKWPYALIIMTILIGTIAIGEALMKSRTGYYWRALRDNEQAAEALGVNARAFKLRCFMLSAGISALCGAFYANYVAFVDPRSVLGVELSIQMLVYSIVGGMSLLWGPLIGAAVLVPFSILLRDYSAIPGSDIVVYAVLLAVLALVLPQGIAGWFVARWQRRRLARRASRTAEVVS
ncbi:amino acid ABC transporter permease [Steroidobacter agaridevorans]|uniref:Amino acid ABC transporter permease n=1 Tax=Steroidobacter agaridevorans TaxID=2695856 RepID=A0A829Y751_9GAMM|nr:branched-chain amino acid ABC transporter permease [Steroidobacter agaridevorans]GFE78442.1 amino acid ABC transporter permease [Steroidobacter agaridevorans]GFE89626.1 amino acid ABC transporter permease [Steroidobacter agaridevorans]